MELLELILQESGLQYISDLNDGIEKRSVKEAVKEIPYEEYELKEWKEAVSYLTGGKVFLETKDDILKYIKNV